MPEPKYLGKQASLYTVILLISLGLCGFGMTGNGTIGFLGLIGIFIGVGGLFVTGIEAIMRRK